MNKKIIRPTKPKDPTLGMDEILKSIRDIDKDAILVLYADEWGDLYNAILCIRLSLPFVGACALNPVAIISSHKSKYDLIMGNTGKTFVEVLLTPGIEVFSSIDEITELNPILIRDYYKKFLPHIKVNSPVGSHSISNDWAAFNIMRVLGENDEIPKTNDLRYLSYLLVSGMTEQELTKLANPSNGTESKSQIKNLSIDCKSKILLIDDQDDIWKNVVSKLINNNNNNKDNNNNNIRLDVWGKNRLEIELEADKLKSIKIKKESNPITTIIKNYDVVLLDMRLAGSREQHQDTDNISGIKLLKDILNKESGNPGQRVIVFTSSNKAWNIRRCLQIGAQDIFIKESPMYPLQEEERIKNINNLIGEIKKGIENSWLKVVYKKAHEVCKICKDPDKNLQGHKIEKYAFDILNECNEKQKDDWLNFFTAIATQIEIATTLFLASDKDNDEEMRMAYISLETVFELISQKWKESHYDDSCTYERVKQFIEIYINKELIEYSKIEKIIGTLITIRNKSVHKNGQKEYRPLVEKCETHADTYKSSGSEFCWKTIERKTEEPYNAPDYVLAYRALTDLLYLIFYKKL